VIREFSQSAAYNMAADFYLLERAESEKAAPVLRIYGWERPTITIGYHQTPGNALRLDRLGTTPVVKRPTGGRALYHTERELTYAMAGNFLTHPSLGKSLHETYLIIARAIAAFYDEAGWKVKIAHKDFPLQPEKAPGARLGCFASFSKYEISCNGQKVAASSQRRTQSAFLQHGAIKLETASRHPAIVYPARLQEAELQPLSGTWEEYAEKFIETCARQWQFEPAEIPFADSEREAIFRLTDRFEISSVQHISD
jgi:lipoate-protein ligase A